MNTALALLLTLWISPAVVLAVFWIYLLAASGVAAWRRRKRAILRIKGKLR